MMNSKNTQADRPMARFTVTRRSNGEVLEQSVIPFDDVAQAERIWTMDLGTGRRTRTYRFTVEAVQS